MKRYRWTRWMKFVFVLILIDLTIIACQIPALVTFLTKGEHIGYDGYPDTTRESFAPVLGLAILALAPLAFFFIVEWLALRSQKAANIFALGVGAATVAAQVHGRHRAAQAQWDNQVDSYRQWAGDLYRTTDEPPVYAMPPMGPRP